MFIKNIIFALSIVLFFISGINNLQTFPGEHSQKIIEKTKKENFKISKFSESIDKEENTDKYIYEYAQRGLLILLDDNEQVLGTIGETLITMLDQKSGPIIVSTNVIHNINTYPKTKSQNNFIKALNFQDKEWIIKEISNELYLLIPEKHISTLKINKDDMEKNDIQINPISQTELTLGLKVNHMKTISSLKDIIKQSSLRSSDYIKDNLKNIFCEKKHYANKKAPIPFWTIYIQGHGLKSEYIVGVTLDTFKTILDFFHYQIKTKLLIYESCYAAGTNSEILYQDNTKAIQKSYSFPIITIALTDAPTSAPSLWVKNDGKIDHTERSNFYNFLEFATKNTAINYEEVIPHLHKLTSEEHRNNVPQIRLPGTEWFSAMATEDKILSIGSILSKTRNKTLNTSKSIKTNKYTNPEIILIYTNEVPFEIAIDSPALRSIVAMNPEKILKINKISTTTKTANAILEYFASIAMLDQEKIIFIKEIKALDETIENAIIFYKQIPKSSGFGTTTGVDVHGNPSQCTFFFKKNNTFFMKSTECNSHFNVLSIEAAKEIKEQSKEQVLYKRLLSEIEGKIAYGECKYRTKTVGPQENLIGVPRGIQSSCTIEKITGDQYAPLISIIKELQVFLYPNTYAEVKKIQGQYDDYTEKLIQLPCKENDTVTLTDVVITKPGLCYCTYDKKFYLLDISKQSYEAIPAKEIIEDYKTDAYKVKTNNYLGEKIENNKSDTSSIHTQTTTKSTDALKNIFSPEARKRALAESTASPEIQALSKKLDSLKESIAQLKDKLGKLSKNLNIVNTKLKGIKNV